MKLQKVVIKNLNCIENGEVDFTKSPLCDEPLFLICGDTGTGKSTILDAITLALYDKSPRYEKMKNKELTTDGIAADNPARILRKGCSDGFAQVFFQVQEQHYVATWSMHLTRNNTFDSNNRRKLEVVNGDSFRVVSSKINEVNTEIAKLININYEQFMRSVMLAQGDFGLFLTSEKKDQAAILEMLTGTEIYSRISEEMKSRKKSAKDDYETVKTQLGEANRGLKTKEELEELEKNKAESDKQIKENDNKTKTIEGKLTWMADYKAGREQCQKAQTSYENALKRKNDAEVLTRRERVEDYQATTAIRQRLNDADRLSTEVNSLKAELNQEESVYEDLLASRDDLQRQMTSLSDEKEKLHQALKQYEGREAVLEQTTVIIDILKQADESSKKMNQIQKLLQQTDQEIQTKEQEKQQHEQSLKDLGTKSHQALEGFNQAKSVADQYNMQELQKQSASIQIDLDKANSQLQKLARLKENMDRYVALEKEVKTLQNALEELKTKQAECQKAQDDSELAFKEKNAVYESNKAMVEDWAKEYRSHLIEGQKCPVCGSTHHPYLSGKNVVDSLFAQIEKEKQEAEKQFTQAKDANNQLMAALKEKNETIRREQFNLDREKENVFALCHRESFPTQEEYQGWLDKWNNNAKEAKQRDEDNKKTISEGLEKAKVTDRLRQEKEKAERTEQNAKDQLKDLTAGIDTLRETRNGKNNNLLQQKEYYERQIQDVSGKMGDASWKEAWQSDPVRFVNGLHNSSEDWKAKKDALQKVEDEDAQCQDIMKMAAPLLVEMKVLWPEHRRGQMRGNKVMPNQLQSQCVRLQTEAQKNKTDLQKKEEEYQTAIAAVEKFLAEYSKPLTIWKLRDLNAIQNIEEDRVFLKTVEDNILTASTDLKNRKEALTQLEQKPQKTDWKLEENLRTEMKELVNAHQTLQTDLARIVGEIQHSKEQQKRVGSLLTDISKKETRYLMLDNLCRALGATDNNNFRDVAQSYTMAMLLKQANYFMEQLSNRYQLYCKPGSLAIEIVDNEMGGMSRTVTSLSGGEMFLASLALALGLASLNNQDLDIDMLFIDEGFGTLDGESLDLVMNTLEQLQSIGRKVGIISHVNSLKERITAQVQLKRKDNMSTSEIKICKL